MKKYIALFLLLLLVGCSPKEEIPQEQSSVPSSEEEVSSFVSEPVSEVVVESKTPPDRSAEYIYDNNPALTKVDYNSPALLPPTEDAGQEYIDKIVFLCDSPTYWLKPFAMLTDGMDTKQIWTGPEGTQTFTYYKSYKLLDPYDNTERLGVEMARIHKPEYMVIALGINGISFMSEADFISVYTELVNDIKNASPETVILLQSIYPISPRYIYWGAITNEKITKANYNILKIAENTGCKYLDTYSVLTDGNGNVLEEYSLSDGFHLNKTGLSKVLEYIRTHAYTED